MCLRRAFCPPCSLLSISPGLAAGHGRERCCAPSLAGTAGAGITPLHWPTHPALLLPQIWKACSFCLVWFGGVVCCCYCYFLGNVSAFPHGQHSPHHICRPKHLQQERGFVTQPHSPRCRTCFLKIQPYTLPNSRAVSPWCRHFTGKSPLLWLL